MFGFVRPCKAELKVRELALFQAVYCGLCHSLKKQAGPLARFGVNYDLTVLAMLLSEAANGETVCRRRCIASPLRKRACCCQSGPGDTAADLSLVLLRWKLEDNLQDEGFFRRIAARLLLLLLKRGIKAARSRQSAFDLACQEQLRNLKELEDAGCSSLDQAAHPFASLLAEASEVSANPRTRRILRLILYHLGRFVYLADAVADLEEDGKKGRYNPITAHYGLEFGENEKERIRETMCASAVQAANALALLEPTPYLPILENIFTLGMPETADKVLRGESLGKERKWRIG